MPSLFVGCKEATITINGTPLSGKPIPRDIAGHTISTAMLAFSETWIKRLTPKNSVKRRIPLVDVLRGVALAAMAVYHFAWDLSFFSLADFGVTENPLWIAFARAIAGSFLALVGVGLVSRAWRWREMAGRSCAASR